MKVIAIHQPNFLPWPGFFHKWMLADAMVLLDTVQFEKNEWQNRNRIKTAQGAHWLTVPVSFRYPETIASVRIAGYHWLRKHCTTIEQAYAGAPYFEAYWPSVREVLQRQFEYLRDLNVALIRLIGRVLGCAAPLHLASTFGVDNSEPTERLIALCTTVGGSAYLSGREGRRYLQDAKFARAGLALYFQQLEAPVYPQRHGAFVPHLSVLDMLFNTGPDAEKIIRGMGEMEQ